eukprot:gene6785-12355_t
MATTTFHTTRSEEEIGEKVDKCLTDGLIKAGKGWPVAFGVGTGLGMAVSNCQHQFKQLLPTVSLDMIEINNQERNNSQERSGAIYDHLSLCTVESSPTVEKIDTP